MPTSRAAPAASTWPNTPISSRSRDAWGLRYSEHGLGRGKCARSMIITSTPARANRQAVIAPAGPPPTMRTLAPSAFTASHRRREHLSLHALVRLGREEQRVVHDACVEPRLRAPDSQDQ